jgi:hypothetical protein
MNTVFRDEIIDYIDTVCSGLGKIECSKISDGIHMHLLILKRKIVLFFHTVESAETDTLHLLKEWNHKKKNYRIVHIWEDQWSFHREKIQSMLLSMLGLTERIHGRETKIVQIDNAELTDFLRLNHMNVPIKAKYKYGLKKDGETAAVMSFSKPRKIERDGDVNNSFELLRFCNKLNTTVVGGFSKLLNQFIKMQRPDDIMTYVDADWSSGKTFIKCGFELTGELPAMEFWLNLNTGEREYPHMVLKRLALPADINWSKAEEDIFLNKNNYKKVFNSGSYKYVLFCKDKK